MRDFADHLALIQIEVQRHAHVLQMVIAARRIRPVRARATAPSRTRETKSRRREKQSMARTVCKVIFIPGLARELRKRTIHPILYLRIPANLEQAFFPLPLDAKLANWLPVNRARRRAYLRR